MSEMPRSSYVVPMHFIYADGLAGFNAKRNDDGTMEVKVYDDLGRPTKLTLPANVAATFTAWAKGE